MNMCCSTHFPTSAKRLLLLLVLVFEATSSQSAEYLVRGWVDRNIYVLWGVPNFMGLPAKYDFSERQIRQFTAQIKRVHPKLKILVVLNYADDNLGFPTLGYGPLKFENSGDCQQHWYLDKNQCPHYLGGEEDTTNGLKIIYNLYDTAMNWQTLKNLVEYGDGNIDSVKKYQQNVLNTSYAKYPIPTIAIDNVIAIENGDKKTQLHSFTTLPLLHCRLIQNKIGMLSRELEYIKRWSQNRSVSNRALFSYLMFHYHEVQLSNKQMAKMIEVQSKNGLTEKINN